MNHHLYKTTLLGLSLLAAAPRAQAQNADKKFALSGYATLLQYRGDLGNNFWDTRNATYGGGLTLSRYVSKGFDVNLSANQSTLRFPPAKGTFTSTGPADFNNHRFYANVSTFGLGLKLKLPLKDELFVHPYILLQPGFAVVYTDRYASPIAPVSHTSFAAFDGQAALGLDFRLTPSVGLFLQAGQHFLGTTDSRLDGVGGTSSDNFFDRYDRYMQFSSGLTVNFGKAKDTDGDGVPDRKDKCPDTPTGVKVDATGCPVDTDGDGVADYQDKCPDQKGVAALQGCPDADADGVADASDKCPNTPAGVAVDATGCPLDADADGVADYQDKCPNTPAGVKVNPTGCPVDTDGDGVADYQDKCPDRAGPASNQGCPEIPAETRKILNEATRYINFDFDKATLKASSFPRLQQLVQIMTDYPDYSLSIAGHTDSKGDDNHNLRLSYERAVAARTYMLSKGVPANRIEARGYGETKPIADNKTAAGQAQNRRVDFDPYLTGTPNSAEVKYGPAPTVRELLRQGKTSPVPARKVPARKAPARKPAAARRK